MTTIDKAEAPLGAEHIGRLPDVLVCKLSAWLDVMDHVKFGTVCRRFRKLTSRPTSWCPRLTISKAAQLRRLGRDNAQPTGLVVSQNFHTTSGRMLSHGIMLLCDRSVSELVLDGYASRRMVWTWTGFLSKLTHLTCSVNTEGGAEGFFIHKDCCSRLVNLHLTIRMPMKKSFSADGYAPVYIHQHLGCAEIQQTGMSRLQELYLDVRDRSLVPITEPTIMLTAKHFPALTKLTIHAAFVSGETIMDVAFVSQLSHLAVTGLANTTPWIQTLLCESQLPNLVHCCLLHRPGPIYPPSDTAPLCHDAKLHPQLSVLALDHELGSTLFDNDATVLIHNLDSANSCYTAFSSSPAIQGSPPTSPVSIQLFLARPLILLFE